jgi:hypothetical protein
MIVSHDKEGNAVCFLCKCLIAPDIIAFHSPVADTPETPTVRVCITCAEEIAFLKAARERKTEISDKKVRIEGNPNGSEHDWVKRIFEDDS